MDQKWVLDQNTPEVDSKSNFPVPKANSAPYKSNFHKYDLSTTKHLVDKMAQIDARTSLNDIEVIYDQTKQVLSYFR